jgi:hypothetical protein
LNPGIGGRPGLHSKDPSQESSNNNKVHMYVNGKKISIPGMGRGRMKENGGGGEFKYDIL